MKIKLYYIDYVDFNADLDFEKGGKCFFTYELDEKDPCIKAINSQQAVIIRDGLENNDLWVDHCYRDIHHAADIAIHAIRRVCRRLSKGGVKRAEIEIARIKSILDEDRKVKNKAELDKISVVR